MSERVPGPTERPLAATRRRVPQDQLAGLGLGPGHNPLLQPDPVGEGGTGHGTVETGGSDGDEEDGHGEDHREPERGRPHYVHRRAEVGVVKEFGVERERKAEVEEDAAPDDEMVETGPVQRVQGTLHDTVTR